MIAWKLWTSVPTVALWEAVALVLEIDPRSLRHQRDAWMAGSGCGPLFERGSFPSQAKREDFETALSFAERAANVVGPIHLRTRLAVGMNRRTAQVSLAEVVAFFVSCEWPDIPAPLLALLGAVAGTSEPSQPEQPLGANLPPASAVVVSERHSIKRRADPLAAVLAEAQRQALNSTDWLSVWAALVKVASSPSRPPPLLGYVEGEGVKYQTDDAEKPDGWLSRDAFRKRFSRKRCD